MSRDRRAMRLPPPRGYPQANSGGVGATGTTSNGATPQATSTRRREAINDPGAPSAQKMKRPARRPGSRGAGLRHVRASVMPGWTGREASALSVQLTPQESHPSASTLRDSMCPCSMSCLVLAIDSRKREFWKSRGRSPAGWLAAQLAASSPLRPLVPWHRMRRTITYRLPLTGLRRPPESPAWRTADGEPECCLGVAARAGTVAPPAARR